MEGQVRDDRCMPEILLTTFNAKYIHAAFGLRYLLANLQELEARAAMVEFDIQQQASDIVEALLARSPRIVGIGVYIWNAQLSLEVVTLVKRLDPGLLIVLGGPEVSYETDQQAIVALADYVITGEADLCFAELCRELLSGRRPGTKVLHAEIPDLTRLKLPYEYYDDRDVAHRVIYVEASRGCPFTCEFCLSSLDIPVRAFPLPDLLRELEQLLARGVRQFKFVDRTFNLNLQTGRAILEFFLARYQTGLFLHFEMIPDRLPDGLRECIARFPAGALQFEIGIQTFNEAVAARIKRQQKYERLADNFRFLREQTGIHIHADLIAGLPGEDLESFGRGFDRLVAMRPQEIQVGLLKRLRGTPIARHDEEWQMVYSPMPPYEILRTKDLSFSDLQRLRRFARYWDLVANSGNFVESTPHLWQGSPSAFQGFLRWSDWLHKKLGRKHGIALTQLAESLFCYLTDVLGQEHPRVAESLWRDYRGVGRSDVPAFLRPYVNGMELPQPPIASKAPRGQQRQARHLSKRGGPAPRAN
jgi:radical SAM superfamily enzyme YgiQ (UPF0313 family)